MKTISANKAFSAMAFITGLLMTVNINAQYAVSSTPMGIGKNCGGTSTTDSFRVLSYDKVTNQLSPIYRCKPKLGGGTPAGTAFSSSAGSVAYNPYDQNVYYIATTTGNESFVYNWRPDTCHITGPNQAWSYYYPGQFVVGLDFNPKVANEGYQLELTGSSAPYNTFLRKVNFSTNYFGPSEPLTLTAGKKIYQQSGDIIFTPSGDLYVAFNNKIFKIDYSTYGTGGVTGTFIDTLNLGAGYALTGIAYVAKGTFIGSTQKGTSPCKFVEIDISTGSAVISPVTLPANNFTATDMATLITGIGAAKKVSYVVPLTGTNWLVIYDVKIKNYGNSFLKNVQLKDSVAKVFGAAFSSASVSALGTLPSGLTINPGYNGQTDCNIFAAGGTMRASPQDSATVRIFVYLNNPNINTTYKNSALASAQGTLFSNNVSDSSNNDGVLRCDLNNNDIPDDNNEDVPTPLIINNWIFLPLNILDFNASPLNKTVQVQWSLINKDEGGFIEVQRSNNGTDFMTVNNLQAKTNESIQKFSWLDERPGEGVNYYRIKITSATGKETFSETVKVVFNKSQKDQITVGPNPFSGNLHFTIKADKPEKITYRLIDMNLKTLVSQSSVTRKGDNYYEINNLYNLPSGMYLLQVVSGQDTYTKKVVKAN